MSSSSNRGSTFAFMVFAGICLFGSRKQNLPEIPANFESMEGVFELLEPFFLSNFLKRPQEERHFILRVLDKATTQFIRNGGDSDSIATAEEGIMDLRRTLGIDPVDDQVSSPLRESVFRRMFTAAI